MALPNSPAITNAYDAGGRLLGTWLKNSGGTILNKHSYLFDAAGRRQRQTHMDSKYVLYGYDNDSQLASALGYNSNGTPIASEQISYTYDAAWNMKTRVLNGTTTTYTTDARNQLSNISGLGACGYDANGNITSRVYDPSPSKTLSYSYDYEQQLLSVFTDTVNTPTNSRWMSSFVYDGLRRLRKRIDYVWGSPPTMAYDGASILSPGSWTVSAETRFIYDGMRVIQERSSANVPTVSYTWGNDLSGSLQGAGGIGGLLARSHGYSAGTWSTNNFYHSDAGGNVTFMINKNTQLSVASYKYDAFGRTLSQTGTLASANVYRFSSKPVQGSSGLYYYGYRFYDPMTQRWLNRDPIGEVDGPNLYGFVHNNPIANYDSDGRWIATRLFRVYQVYRKNHAIQRELVCEIRGKNLRDSLKEMKGALDSIPDNVHRAVEAENGVSAKGIAEKLSTNKGCRGPEGGEPYRRHYNPEEGPYRDVHVEPGFSQLVAVALIPHAYEASKTEGISTWEFTASSLWDVLNGVDPVGVTDLMEWIYIK